MKFPRVLLATIVSAVAALSLCASAGAANVIVGPSLTSGAWESFECGEPICISYNTALGGSGPYVTSPVSGAVVGFSVVGGETQGTYKLRSLIPATQSPLLALFRKASAPVAAIPTAGVRSYPTLLPIQAGEGVALVWGGTATLGFAEPAGAAYTEWEPTAEPAENSSAAGESFEELAGFNVEVQPAPTVTGLGTTSGPTTGGTSVTISGADLENATGVSFGSVPAASYTVNSESQITAVAPARESAASVSVTVTTIAGQANSPQQFGYVAPPPPPVVPAPVVKTKKPVKQCLVPNLKGKKLPAAKAALKKADCKAGKVTKLKGATPKTGKVAAQSRKAGAKATVGAKVNLTLKP